MARIQYIEKLHKFDLETFDFSVSTEPLKHLRWFRVLEIELSIKIVKSLNLSVAPENSILSTLKL